MFYEGVMDWLTKVEVAYLTKNFYHSLRLLAYAPNDLLIDCYKRVSGELCFFHSLFLPQAFFVIGHTF